MGDVAKRTSAGLDYRLPQVYEQYTHTAFLGKPKIVEAGHVSPATALAPCRVRLQVIQTLGLVQLTGWPFASQASDNGT